MTLVTTTISSKAWTAIEFTYAATPGTIKLPLQTGNPSADISILIPQTGVPLLLPQNAPLPDLSADGFVGTPVNGVGIQIGFNATKVYFQAAPPVVASSTPIIASNTPNPAENLSSIKSNVSMTATFASSSATATNSIIVKSPGVSSGAAAGIAIGCLIAGIFIAGLVFWFCWRKRKAAGIRDHEASRIALMPAHEKGFAANTIPLGNGSSLGSPVSAALPLPLEDKAITGEISKIANSIKNHVQSYYQNSRVSPGLVDVDDIHAIGVGQPISAGILSTLLGNTATREIALRFCIAWAICSRMQPGADPKTSLLPQEVAGCVQSITPQKSGSPG